MNTLDKLLIEFKKEICNKVQENSRQTEFNSLFEDFMMQIDKTENVFLLRNDNDKEIIGTINFIEEDVLGQNTTKILNYKIKKNYLGQDKLKELFIEFCKHHFLPDEEKRILIPFSNADSYIKISDIFDKAGKRFWQPKMQPIEDFLPSDNSECLETDKTLVTIGWQFKLDDLA